MLLTIARTTVPVSEGWTTADRLLVDRPLSRISVVKLVVDGYSLVWVAHSQGASAGLMYQPSLTSNTVPVFATASGKAWLATLPSDQAMEIVMKNGGLKDADR